MLQLYPSIGRSELPIDFGVFAVSFFLPRVSFGRKRLFVGNSSVKALSGQNVQFDFGDIEPAAMFGRVNYFESTDQSPGFLGRKGFVQGAQAVRVEVVHHESNSLRFSPMDVDQLADGLGPVGFGSLI